MPTNATERLINHQDGLDIVQQLKEIKEAILAKPSTGEATIDDILANIRNGTAPTNYPIGTELTFLGNDPQVSTFQGNTDPEATAGITGVTVNKSTYVKKAGNTAGTNTFYFDGTSWRLGSATGTVVKIDTYGITVQGTPISGDYASVSLSSSDYVFQVMDYDFYELQNDNVKHHMVLMAKERVKDNQQWDNAPQLFQSCDAKAMPAGKYCLTLHELGDGETSINADGIEGSKTVRIAFTTTKETPLGGGLAFANYRSGEWSDGVKVKVWSTDRKTFLEEVATAAYDDSVDSDAADLGDFYYSRYDLHPAASSNEFGAKNYAARICNGVNEYGSCLFRQWLEADKPAGEWWVPENIFAIFPESKWPDQRDGFLYGLNPDLKNAIVKAKITCQLSKPDLRLASALGLGDKLFHWGGSLPSGVSALQSLEDGAKEEIATGVFAPLEQEIGLSPDGRFALYDDFPGTQAYLPNIKLGETNYWFTRSRCSDNDGRVVSVIFTVGNSGYAASGRAPASPGGVVPVIVIG